MQVPDSRAERQENLLDQEKALEKMSSSEPEVIKHNNTFATKHCLLQSHDLPACSLVWKSWLLLQALLRLLADVFWACSTFFWIDSKSSLTDLSCGKSHCWFKAMSAYTTYRWKAFSSMCSGGNDTRGSPELRGSSRKYIFSTAREGCLGRMSLPCPGKGLPTGLATVFFSLSVWFLEM